MNNNSTRSYPVPDRGPLMQVHAFEKSLKAFTLFLMLLIAGISSRAQVIYANYQGNQVNGSCVPCGVMNPNNPINNANLSDYSQFSILPDLPGVSVEQTLFFPVASTNAGGDEIVIGVQSNNATMEPSYFAGVVVETFNGGVSNNDAQYVSPAMFRQSSGPARAEIVIKPTQAFGSVKVTLISSLVGSLDGLMVLYAYYHPDVQPDANGVVFVKKGSSGSGSSWTDALGEVADALKGAKYNAAIRQIWVAGGTYKPKFSGSDNEDLSQAGFRSLVMVNNVKMFGGFAGTETSVNQRDLSIATNETILSGDIDDNDGAGGAITGSNALHVLIAAGAGVFHLDGFSIQGGKSDISPGEMIVNGVSVPGTRGAALYTGYATVNVNACKVRGHSSSATTIAVDNSDAFFANTQITGNLSGTASGILSSHSNVQLLNITFSGNSGNYVLYNLNSTVRADNSVFYNNGGSPDNGSTYYNHCLLTRSPAGTNINKDPDFVQPIPYSAAPSTGGNYQLKPGSPALNAGNNAVIKTLGSEGIQMAEMADYYNGSGCSGLSCAVLNIENITDNNNTANYCVLNIAQASSSFPGRAFARVGWSGREVRAGDFVGFVIAEENIPIANPTLLGKISFSLGNDLGGPVYTHSGFTTLQTTTLNGQSVYYLGFTAPVSAKYASIQLEQIPNTVTMVRVHAAFIWESVDPRTNNPYDLLGNPRIANKASGGIVDMGAYESQKQLQTITVADVSKIYGDAAFAPVASAGSGLAVTYSSGNTAIAEPFFDAADGKYKLSIKAAGTVTITADQAGDGNWEAAPAKTFQLTVAQRPVTVGIRSTAVITKGYNGQAQGTFNSANLELANGDIIGSDDVKAKFNGILVYDNANAGDNKTITLNHLALELEGTNAGNYVIGNTADLTFSNATITKAPLTVTPVSGQGKTYGDTEPVLTYSISGTMYNTDAISGALAREAGEDAGDYQITPGSLTAGANYDIGLNDELFTIGKKPVIVSFKTTANLSKVYDGTDKANVQATDLGFAAGTIINADAVGILLSADAAVYDNRNAGDNKTLSVPYSGLLLTGAKAGNYEISNTAVLSTNEAKIMPAPLSITAEAKTKVYGMADPLLTYSISGGQLFATDQLTGALGRNAGNDVGVYPIVLNTLSGGPNYTITYLGANLSITKATQSISWAQNDFEIGCNGAPSAVTLTATSNSGLPVTYVVTNLAIASINGNILTPVAGGVTTITATQAGDNNHEAATAVVKNFKYQLAGSIRQHWADAIFFDNSGGSYTAWQWYKNGNPVSGATRPYYSESVALNGIFHVVATDKNGNVVESCPITAAGTGLTAGIKVSPNPVRAGSTATVTCNYSTGDLVGAKLVLSLVNGTKVQEITQVNASNQFTMPAQGGLYVLTLLLGNGQKASVNVLVK